MASQINIYCINTVHNIAQIKLEPNQTKYSSSSVEDQDANKKILIVPWLSIGTGTRKEYSLVLTINVCLVWEVFV